MSRHLCYLQPPDDARRGIWRGQKPPSERQPDCDGGCWRPGKLVGQLDAEILHLGQDRLPICANPIRCLLLLMLYIGHQLRRKQGYQSPVMALVSSETGLIWGLRVCGGQEPDPVELLDGDRAIEVLRDGVAPEPVELCGHPRRPQAAAVLWRRQRRGIGRPLA